MSIVEQRQTDEQEVREKGLSCPDCGCRDLRVYYTRPLPLARIRRVRKCRNCGRRVVTTERES